MSELQRRWAKAKAGAFTSDIDEVEHETNEKDTNDTMNTDDDGSSSASSASSAGTVVPLASQNLFARPHGLPRGRTLDPIPWTSFFERELFLPDATGTTHHAYVTSPGDKGPLFVMHHGAGASGLSFAAVASEIRKRLPSAGILSMDARGHGGTTSTSSTVDLSLTTLADDLFTTIELAQNAMHWPTRPPLVLVGHSLGGAVVTELAQSFRLGSDLLGFAVLDVVEGSAMDALASMQTYLGTRPAGFATVQAGIDWHLRSRTLRNATSARASVPALLVDRASASDSVDSTDTTDATDATDSQDSTALVWRTDLAATQPFWEGWFAGLSSKFLSARGGKLLLLAGTDRLDTTLTIGQMQGKYALQVFPEAGHFVHEDLPEKTALTLVDFYQRNNRSALVLPPKVSELLAQGKRV